MKYICISMSPAVDALVELDRAPKGEGEIFKNVMPVDNVGGKAINVARWLAIREKEAREVVLYGLLGEDNAVLFEKEFAKYSLVDRMKRIAGSTRRNQMIVWPGGSVKLNEAAFPSLETDAVIGFGDLDEAPDFGKDDIAIISGSLPPTLMPSLYAMFVIGLCGFGVKTVLDSSGAALKYGLEAQPYLIKPNAEECEPLVGFVPKTPKEFLLATDILRGKEKRPNLRGRSEHVLISDGAAGAWYDGEFVPAPKVNRVVDTTAAGDTLLAEFCYRHFGEGMEAIAALKCAVAAGSAAVMHPGAEPPLEDEVAGLIE